MKKLVLLLLVMALLPLGIKAGEVYKSANVRFTLIDEGTIRLEYAPDGKFVDNKSFVAVCRDYGTVNTTSFKETSKQVVITTSKMKVVYTKGNGPFTKDNLTITSVKGAKVPFTWTPGTVQKGNLKGTYRTLDGFKGEDNVHDGKKLPLEDGLLATDGWTLIDDSKSLLFDGAKDWDWVTKRQSAEGSQDWYFMAYGHDYKAALQSFTRFAGKVPLPPRYAFGYWWSRYWSYSDQDFRNLISNFHEYDIPLDVLVIDMDWHPISVEAGGGWTGWDWNEALFPDYKKFLKYLDDEGVKTTMNLHPAEGVRNYEKKYAEFANRLGDTSGKHIEWLGSDKKYVNAMFDTYLHPYMDEGVDFWWLDWQQWLNDKAIPELSNTFWCNYIFFTDMQRYGDKRPMIYHRWGGLGNHRYQIGFSGDAVISWESLAYLPYFNATASNVLYGYWSHDIGGHWSIKTGTPLDPQLYTRAMQMADYLPIMRTHSTKDAALNKEPWAFDNTTNARLKTIIDERYALVPYIYTMARKDYETGLSVCRPMYYDYPEAKEAYANRNEYMFGDNMLVAPITAPVSEDDGYARLNVWLPEGEWLEYETGTMLKGNQTVERAFNMDEYPIYVKAGSIIPYYGKVKNLNGNNQPVIVRVFPGADKGEFEMYEDNGEDNKYEEAYATTPLSYTRSGNTLTVTIGARKGEYKDMPAKRHYSVALPCQLAPSSVSVDGKTAEFSYDGINLEANIDLGEINCANGATVKIEFPQSEYASMLTDGLKAKMKRIQKGVAEYKQKNCNMVYTQEFGFLEAAPLRLTYHPENQEETLRQFSEEYDDLGNVVIEQMGLGENYNRFAKTINEKSLKMEFTDAPKDLFFTKDGKQGFDVKFYNNMTCEGNPVGTAHWNEVNMNTMNSPCEGVVKDEFSTVVESQFCPKQSGTVLFTLSGDDGYRMFINGEKFCGDWGSHSETSTSKILRVEAGKKYDIRLEHFDGVNEAILKLRTQYAK